MQEVGRNSVHKITASKKLCPQKNYYKDPEFTQWIGPYY